MSNFSVCWSVSPSIGQSIRSAFLDASTHLYMRVCPSVVGPSVVGPSVVGLAFFLNREIDKSDKSNKPANMT